ncbi:MLO-like protein 9 [Dionaea muscipula]
MGGGGGGGRELDQTPTWAVAAVCAVIVIISIALEKVLHHVGEYFQEKRKKALYEALEKIEGELMVLGFISLLLTFGQNYISKVCIPEKLASTMLPCAKVYEFAESSHHESGAEHHGSEHHRRLLWNEHRVLSADSPSSGCKAGLAPLISVHGLHQLHIFIFFLAVFHVIYSAITMMLGRLKIRGWKDWEQEAISHDDAARDPARFRLTHETSFVRDNASFWVKTPFLFYIACFFRQFFRSVRRSDYLTLRHGFINVHLAPGSKFDFQKYIKRSLEDDFKVVVGISPLLWASAVFFLLVNVDKWQSMTWLSILPLLVILAVGTKLQAVIAAMAVEITERHAVVQGMPLVQVSDSYFWFSWPQLVLYLIHYVLFQNAFEITYFFWIWYEFGLRSCFHSNFPLTIVRVVLGITVQVTCSYVTLPLYALVTQMGSTMKKSIFDEQTSKAIRKWHKNAKKKNHEGKPVGGGATAPTQTLGGGETTDMESADDTQLDEEQMAKVTATVDLEGKQLSSPPADLLTGT